MRDLSASLQAAEWFARLDAKALSRAEKTQYLNWLKTSPVHIAEMLRISRIHSLLSTRDDGIRYQSPLH